MINYRKYFNEGLNADDDFGMIRPGQWVNASNMRIFSTDTGATGRMEAIGGNKLLFNVLPAGQNHCIGGDADDANQRLFFLNWNENGDHAIYCYYKLTATGHVVLTSAQVEGGLNFSKYYYAHSVRYIDGNLVITDNHSEPRYVNVEAGIKLNQPSFTTSESPYVTPVNINLIKRPPIYRLTVAKYAGSGFANNYTYNNAYQFRYQYVYRDYQESALSTFSELVPMNLATDQFNSIDVTLPTTEQITDYVQKVIVWVKNLTTGKTYRAKLYDKANTDDLASITAHNAGTAITFRFYDNEAKILLDSIQDVTPYDNVSLLSETVEVAKNRVFLGNNLAGYNTPKDTSLTVALGEEDPSASTISGTWWVMTLTGARTRPIRYFIYISNVEEVGWYEYFGGVVPPYPGTVAFADCSFMSNNSNDLNENDGTIVSMVNTGTTSTITGATVASVDGRIYLKSGSSYNVTIAFYDQERRKSGVVNKKVTITVPERTFTEIVIYNNITWALSNTNALTEIPDWAYWYQIHITKNLTTRFFVQGRTVDMTYVSKSPTDGSYVYAASPATFSLASTYAIAVNIKALSSFGLGYVFTAGDLININLDPTGFYKLRVIGTDGEYVLVQPYNIGTLTSGNSAIIEIYTPHLPEEKEPYYETGDMMPISDPTTSSRAYSTTGGFINGSVFVLRRQDAGAAYYNTENMSPLDEKWQFWFTDTGWVNYVDDIGQVRLTQEIRFSDVNLPGTKINGLNKFQPLNVESLPQENGALNKLILANKIQEDGTVMLGICQEETSSMYLGETEVFDTQGSSYVARSAGVIGSIKTLSGSMGTFNPESVFPYNGLVWFYDQRNGGFIQYSNNGLFPISKNGLVRASNLFSKQFASLSATEIEALGSRPFVIGGYDPYHKEALFSVPNTGTPPKGYLVDYPSVIYPYDIYDGQGKTLIYKNEKDMWLGSMSHEWEKFIRMGNELYAFENGCLYIQNQDQPANFGGVQYTAKIMYANNPGGIHTFLALGLESNKKPSFVHVRTEDPYTQSSDLLYRDFVGKEGVQYASLLRDRLTPNATGTYVQKQWAGDRLFGKSLLVMLEYSFSSPSIFDSTFDLTFQGALTDEQINTAKKLELRFSDIGNIVNKGHLFNHAT